MWYRTTIFAFVFLFIGGLCAEAVQAQIWDRVRDRAEREVERRAEDVTSRAVNAVLDEMEDAVVCVVSDPECISSAEEDGKPVVITDEEGELVEVRDGDEEGAAAEAVEAAGVDAEVADDTPRPGEGAWANYDFVPGDQVLFDYAFENETIGRFPQRLEFQEGMLEILEWEDQRLLAGSSSNSRFRVELNEVLPQRFTIEFDAHISAGNAPRGLHVYLSEEGSDHSYFSLRSRNSGVMGPTSSTRGVSTYRDELVPIRIAVDGTYGTMYVGEERVANIPNMEIERNNFVDFDLQGQDSSPTYITNIRIAGGGLELYDRLMADGRVSTQGVYFDTGSDAIRPESTGTLTEIGRMLQQHNDLRLRIEGHTDNVGDAQANMELSDRRAQSVMQYLVNQHGIAADRLEAVGMGEEAPVADNDTAEGRQNNRRVELVRL